MEQLKVLARRGVNCDDEALQQLDLLELGEIEYPDFEELTHNDINRLYGETAVIRPAAQTANRVLTAEAAKNLMELLYLLSQKMFRSSVRYTMTIDEVVREMRTQAQSIRDFCLRVEGKEGRSVYLKALDSHINKISQAIGGT